MPTHYCFIDERRSQRAQEMGAHWDGARLAGCTLYTALQACGFSMVERRFKILNAWCDNGEENTETRDQVRLLAAAGWVVIGMGKKAQAALRYWGVAHRAMVHPATRGARRDTARYQAHARQVLLAGESPAPQAPARSV